MKNLSRIWLLAVGMVLALALATVAVAQEKKGEPKEQRLSGTVQMINKDTSTITIRMRSGNVQRQVVYSSETKFTKQNKPGSSIDEIKEGDRVICLGKFEGVKLMATRIDLRR